MIVPVYIGTTKVVQSGDTISHDDLNLVVETFDHMRGHIFVKNMDGTPAMTVFNPKAFGVEWRDLAAERKASLKYVAVAGYVAEGFRFYGPFADRDDAHAYMDRLDSGDPYSVVEVEPPRPA